MTELEIVTAERDRLEDCGVAMLEFIEEHGLLFEWNGETND